MMKTISKVSSMVAKTEEISGKLKMWYLMRRKMPRQPM